MKQFLTLFTFGIGALFFLAFFATLKPTAVEAASGLDKPGHCSTIACHSLIFASALWPSVERHD